MKNIVGWAFLILLGCNQGLQENNKSHFSLLDSKQSGIDFINQLEEGLNTNILVYEYFYNGGGVAAADFNGDGLEDLYFTSNMGQNELYLNTGANQFKKVTQEAGVQGRKGPWKTGVTIVDINGDEKIDLYLCYSGMLPEEKRKNELWINQGNNAEGTPIFAESAEKYGLASTGFSTQAYFFDPDIDGDLDMLLLNHNPKNLPLLNEESTKALFAQEDAERGLRFFLNEEGAYSDQTEKYGINGSPLSYGLGVGISDVNNDGWPDFYVSNDYAVPDYLYINQGDGTFKNEIEKQITFTSHFSMGNDIADINNDGYSDIVTLDMLPEDNERQKLLMAPDNYSKFQLFERSGFYRQFMRNMLHLNNGNSTFTEVGQYFGISNTDWSWSALLADFDNDGWNDLHVTNGYLRDYTNLDFINYMDDYVAQKGKLVREDVMEIIAKMPASDVSNYLYKNNAGKNFVDITQDWGLQRPSNSNGAAYFDSDLDGDLDLVVNNINQNAFFYQNIQGSARNNYITISLKGNSGNTLGIGTKIILKSGSQVQVKEQFPTRGFQSSVSPTLHFGLGNQIQTVDTLQVVWPNQDVQIFTQVPINQHLIVEQKNAISNPTPIVSNENPIIFKPLTRLSSSPISSNYNDFDRQLLLMQSYSNETACLEKGDINGDGLEDLFIGGNQNTPGQLYLRQTNGEMKLVEVPSFLDHAYFVDTDALMEDFNGDGWEDLLVLSGGYHDLRPEDPRLLDRLYLNDGSGNLVYFPEGLPNIYHTSKVAMTMDFNEDGYQDLFIGGSTVPGKFPTSYGSTILINQGNGRFSIPESNLGIDVESLQRVNAVQKVDWNGDGKDEIFVASEWASIRGFKKNGDLWEEMELPKSIQEKKGLWTALMIEDFNADGQPDILAGNWGLNMQFAATSKEPAQLHYFPTNGGITILPIFSYYIQGASYPDVTRGELLKQLPQNVGKFTTYRTYAQARLNDILDGAQLKAAEKLTINETATLLFLSSPKGHIEAPLPQEIQYAPIHALSYNDFDGDGIKDLLAAGNNSFTKLRFGYLEANYGLLLKGLGDGKFQAYRPSTSGLSIRGSVRDLIQIDRELWLISNEAPLQAYTF
jgi:hypothetical protein